MKNERTEIMTMREIKNAKRALEVEATTAKEIERQHARNYLRQMAARHGYTEPELMQVVFGEAG